VARLVDVARANAAARAAGETWTGFACAIDPVTWAS